MKRWKMKAAAAAVLAALAFPGAAWAAEQAPAVSAEAAIYNLDFDRSAYTKERMTLAGETVAFRAYRGIVYVANPASKASETMDIYVPEAYFQNGTVNGYTKETAPIFLPNGVGGYMPGSIAAPSERDPMSGGANASLVALSRGLVVAAPAIRGRTTEENGVYVGKAPALIVDYKAAVRYLRHNRDRLPAGNTERIVSNGTSAGGALSALLGATGNSPDYADDLKAIGAADARDDIFASMDYCPITNLDHADMAYEWMFAGVNTAYQRSGQMMPPQVERAGEKPAGNRPEGAPVEEAQAREMTAEEITASAELKALFPAYVNSLALTDEKGKPLRMNADGTGSFAEYIKGVYRASAQTALDAGEDLSDIPWLTVKNGKAGAVDLQKYAAWATRLKAAPAFDKLDLSSGENDEFGTTDNTPRHFTRYGLQHTAKAGEMAPAGDILRLNPLHYIGRDGVKVAPHFRIRHGAKDRDTTIAIPAILALTLANHGVDVDFASPWGKGHAGDYDLEELFSWIDRICME